MPQVRSVSFPKTVGILLVLAGILWTCTQSPAASGAAAEGDPGSETAESALRAARLVESLVVEKVRQHPGPPSTNAQLGGELEKVSEIYRELTRKYPENASIREAYGSFLWNLERRDAAVREWLEGEKLDSQNAGIAFHLGNAWLDRGEVRTALAYLERASRLAPQNPLYHVHLGNALYLFRHEATENGSADAGTVLQRALEHLRRAAELEPMNAELARGYAETFYIMPRPDWPEALKAWEKYLELAENKDFAYLHLARVNLRMGRKAEARACLDRIKSKDYERVRSRLLEQTKPESEIAAPSPAP